jgi:hypothetical protein
MNLRKPLYRELYKNIHFGMNQVSVFGGLIGFVSTLVI